ncbi:MAG: hypothetical protein ACRD9W_02465 [Terriglobia bacterium]
MRTLTALTVAALIAGVSIASAQSTTMGHSNMGQSTASVTGSGKFCIKSANGALNCEYASLSACKKGAKSGESCEARPSSTTGSKSKY